MTENCDYSASFVILNYFQILSIMPALCLMPVGTYKGSYYVDIIIIMANKLRPTLKIASNSQYFCC